MNNILKLSSVLGLFVCSILHASIIRIPDDYPTIQMGIDSAARYDTISIAADSFHECIEICKPLTIMGAGIDSTVITPPDTGEPGLGYAWNIHVKADSVRIMKLVQHGKKRDWYPGYPSKIGIRIDSCEGGSIENCVISENGCLELIKSRAELYDNVSGIFILNSSNLSVIQCAIIGNCYSGIQGHNCHHVLLQGNDMSYTDGVYYGNGFGGPASGVELQGCDSIWVRDNTISHTRGHISSSGCGVSLDSCEYVTIEKNEILYSAGGEASWGMWPDGGGDGYGVRVRRSRHTSVIRNVIALTEGGSGWDRGGGDASGVSVSDSSNAIIAENTISGTRGGWTLPSLVSGDGMGIECRGASCVIDRNAIMDNQCGARIHATDVSIEECNFYFNTYQRYPTTPRENYELRADSVISAKNNFWWHTDSTKIDSLIDGPACFVPFATALFDSAPGEPSAVTSVRIFSDTAYSIPFTVPAKYRDCLYIELQGVDWNNHFIDPAIVIVTSKKAPLGIGVALIETDTAAGVYRGCAQIDTMSNDVWNMIGTNPGDTVIVCANVDGAKCDTVVVEGAGVEEGGNAQLSTGNYQFTVSPNPFIHSTIIEYHVPVKTDISLEIYDITGRTVKTLVSEAKEPGIHKVTWSAEGLVTGVYFVKLVVDEHNEETRKLILLRQ